MKSQTGSVPCDCTAWGQQRTATAENPSLSKNREEVCGQRKSSGSSEQPTQRVRPQVLARYRTSVSTRRERAARQCVTGGNTGLK